MYDKWMSASLTDVSSGNCSKSEFCIKSVVYIYILIPCEKIYNDMEMLNSQRFRRPQVQKGEIYG